MNNLLIFATSRQHFQILDFLNHFSQTSLPIEQESKYNYEKMDAFEWKILASNIILTYPFFVKLSQSNTCYIQIYHKIIVLTVDENLSDLHGSFKDD